MKSGKIDQSLKPLKKSNQEEYSINVSTSLRIKIRFSIHVSEKTTVRLILFSTRQKMRVSMEDLMNYRESLLYESTSDLDLLPRTIPGVQ